MTPQALNIRGSTQPEVFRATVEAMARSLSSDPDRFWQDSFTYDGPLEIWEIDADRFVFNGNHRFHAAVLANADIPEFAIRIVVMTGSTIPTYALDPASERPATLSTPGCRGSNDHRDERSNRSSSGTAFEPH